MWFRNLQVYRLGAVRGDPEQWCRKLEQQRLTPLGGLELARSGWIPPRGDGAPLVHHVNRQLLLVLATEKKSIPAGAVNLALDQRAVELEKEQGFAPGKKVRKELRERIVDEMLPRALVTRATTKVWVDPVNGWLAVDSSAPARADEVLKFLLKAFDKFPIESWRVQHSPIGAMTEWLKQDDMPAGFTADTDATLRAPGGSKAQVAYKRHSLDPDDVGRHITEGKQCHQLGMTWDGKISFMLTDSLAIKTIRPLDVLGVDERAKTEDQDERFDSDFRLMTGEFNGLLRDLQTALGGEAKC